MDSRSIKTQRMNELATILARGILRLREKLANTEPIPLDVPDKTRLTVSPRFRKLESRLEKTDAKVGK